MDPETVILYGAPHSLYTGRARSYLIKAGIPYRETTTRTARFHKEVRPKCGGPLTIPIVELSDGTVVRDGAAIIEHFEAKSNAAFTPKTPKQNLVSLLFDVIGAEGLLRPAMHYRWSFADDQLDFLTDHFRMITRRDPPTLIESRTEKVMHLMGQIAGPSFGVAPETASVIETLYARQLQALDRHFEKYGYLLGGRPCIGDFGMIAPLYAHLARDPIPLAIMLQNAHWVFRWVERMNRSASDLCEFDNESETWLDDDEIPKTLIFVLRAMAEDFVPETIAAADRINEWLDQQGNLAPGTVCERGVGKGQFELHGFEINALAQPYRFFLLQKFQTAYAALGSNEKAEMELILSEANMTALPGVKVNRKIGFQNNSHVWL